MTLPENVGSTWLGFFRRHERRLAAGYLVGFGLLAVAMAVPTVRHWTLAQVQEAVDWWNDRWLRRLAEGERLVTAGRAEEAVAYLANLDRVHPATDVRHGRDKERERLLRLLAGSYEATGRRTRALETYRRLVAFDSLNYRNSYLLALASDRLLSGWAEAPEAKDAFAAALRILPAHLPSVRGYIDYYMDRGEFGPVVEAYQGYLDAHLVQEIRLRVADSTTPLSVLVDGRSHEYEVALGSGPVRAGGVLEIATAGFAVAIERAVVYPAPRVGRPGVGRPVVLDLGRAELTAMEPAEHGAFRGLDSTSAVRIRLPDLPDGASRIEFRMALFKPVERALWAVVAKSYRNLLDQPGFAAATARTVTLGSSEEADRVLSRLRWAREGLGDKPNERPF